LYHAAAYGAERDIDFRKFPLESHVATAIVAHHATGLADTLASELGILTPQQPVLITRPWKRVPAGCNGAITWAGTGWSVLGGVLIGMCTVLMDWISGLDVAQYGVSLLLYSGLVGFLGSALDSVVGAVFQATYWDASTKLVYHANSVRPSTAQHLTGVDVLTNEQVNLVSTAMIVVLGGWVIAPYCFS
jgi:uncharacterized protein (TIGR00297 family)